MQENGKLFSFLGLFLIIFMALALKSDNVVTIQNPEKYYIDTVINNVKLGQLTGNRNLAFGVRNITEEALMDKDFEMASKKEDATHHIWIEILYFDIEQVKTNMSIFHKDANNTVIRMRGKLIVDGKTIKTAVAEEISSEIAVSSFIVSEGGGFNQQAASIALKKTSISLIEKLTSNKK